MKTFLCFAILCALFVSAQAKEGTQSARSTIRSMVARRGVSYDPAGVARVAEPNKDLCIACVILTGILSQRSLETGQSPSSIFETFCKDSHNPVGKFVCEAVEVLLDLFGIKDMDPKVDPDTWCQQRSLCATNESCVLFKTWPPASSQPSAAYLAAQASPRVSQRQAVDIPGGDDFWKELLDLLGLLLGKAGFKQNIADVFDMHVPDPEDDKDGDRHTGTTDALRGYNWRGRDCNDDESSVYPGRSARTANVSADSDWNCNGIYGADSSGNLYKDTLCGNSGQMGTIIIGDSAAAHFRIPPFIFSPPEVFDDGDWDGIVHWAANEADWPECNWATGYENLTSCPVEYFGKNVTSLDSIYMRLRQRNLCNHRDYQAIAVNGARTSNVMPSPDGKGDIRALQRDQLNDKPALVFFALIGNDVCNGHPGMSHMTTVPEFKQYVTDSMAYLDTQLPKGSHVVFLPLADGLILHEVLSKRMHPLGVTYTDLYEYLICQQLAPCNGWMSPNATFRQETQDRANNLSAVYPEIVATQKYDHFDMVAAPLGLMEKAVNEWKAEGRDPAELIEPSDGFHPAQTAQMLTSKYLWEWLELNHPSMLGDVNPNNAKIASLFGDQGGY